MPSKRKTASTTPRVRSKSASRSKSTSRSRSTGRTASRSRTRDGNTSSRSRSKTPTRKFRTPASEPKIKHRDSDSSDNESTCFKAQLRPRLATPKNVSGNSVSRSQNVVRKIELTSKETQENLLFVCMYMLVYYLCVRFLPIGQLISSSGTSRRFDHRCNGFATFLIMLGLFCVAEFTEVAKSYGLKPSILFPAHWISLLTAANLIVLVLSVIFYFVLRPQHGRITRSSGATFTSRIKDFFDGRSIRFSMGVEWGILTLRAALTAVIFIHFALLHNQFERYGRLSSTSLIVTIMVSIYTGTFFFLEPAYMTSYDGRIFTIGYKTLYLRFMIPFVTSLSMFYLYQCPDMGQVTGSTFPHNYDFIKIFAVCFFTVGVWIFYMANHQKDLFIREPHHPLISHLEIIAGSSGQRLLAGGWWGVVRRPNYLGTLMMVFAIGLASGCSSFIFWVMPITTTVMHLHRLHTIEANCAKRYGPVWQKYKALVPYRLVPKLY